MSGGTDGRHLARVGVQSYGFMTLRVDNLPLLYLLHSSDKRVPVEAIRWRTDRVFEAVRGHAATEKLSYFRLLLPLLLSVVMARVNS
ncbi:MAG: hypothetical protein J07HX5_01183 [halophilic archaeon J07HX5]|nr:MAG: hypothetical protein J07HX5_01183 [halophilic archaeon J07HX5]